MSLGDRERTLYARHLLLPEIGKGGQAALCASVVHAAEGADPRAALVARDYLERAGVRWSDGAEGLRVDVPPPAEVERLAGADGLVEAAAAVAGAFAAVEAIKRIVGAGTAAALPEDLSL